jgi:hypothetical protein
MIVNAGLAIISNLVSGLGGTVPKYLGHGTGVVAPAVTDTALGTASADTRATGTPTRITVTATNDCLQVVGTLSSGSTQGITEAAEFDAVTAGNMLARGTFGALNLISGDSVAYTWKNTWTGG